MLASALWTARLPTGLPGLHAQPAVALALPYEIRQIACIHAPGHCPSLTRRRSATRTLVPWIACSTTCLEHLQSFLWHRHSDTRNIIWHGDYGGGMPELNEVQNCNTHPCPVDCVQTTGARGVVHKSAVLARRRARAVTTRWHGGVACVAVRDATCNTHACPWTAWCRRLMNGACTKSCVGYRVSRTITTAVTGGVECPYLKQVQACNQPARPTAQSQ